MTIKSNFISFKNVQRIWAIGSIHSNLESFVILKKHILKNFKQGDKIVFLGNIVGLGDHAKETITSVLDLRFKLMAKYLLNADDVVFLRGAQEEMFHKLLQLQIAPNPQEILKWMFAHGVDKTLKSYGFDLSEAENISLQGTIAISKWTSKLNMAVANILGHKEYLANLKHAAYSESKKILFVNRGVDVSRPLSAQNDCFWWGYQNFSLINKPYNTFLRIVRGYQSTHKNNIENAKSHIICTLFNQPLTNKKIYAGLFLDNGEILDLFESK
ncbi:MAG: hypothetical protein CMI96_00265 [Pelagibacteraceae bacterium]|nr:hypothetical protein [Pelagibacteraceae bacterium]